VHQPITITLMQTFHIQQCHRHKENFEDICNNQMKSPNLVRASIA